MSTKTTHQAAVDALLPETARAEHARRVQALRARNAMLTILETTREQQGITKQALAELAGLDASSVRRLLTSATANPTTDNAFRLMAAMGIALEARLPTGERVQVVNPGFPASPTVPTPRPARRRGGRAARAPRGSSTKLAAATQAPPASA